MAITAAQRVPQKWLLLIVATFFSGIVLIVHRNFFQVFPTPLFQADSGAYFSPALDLLFTHRFTLSSNITPGYPLILFFCLKAFHNFFSVLVLQHFFHLATAVLAGFFYFRFLQQTKIQAIAISFLVAILPRSLVYAHSIMTDCPYAFLFFLCLFVLFDNSQKPRLLKNILLAILCFLAFTVRPAAIALAFSLVVGIFLLTPLKFRRWKSIFTFCISLTILLFGWATANYFGFGYFGLVQQNGARLFGSTAYLLELNSDVDEKIRNQLRPIYESQQAKFHEPGWVLGDVAGPVQAIARLGYQNGDLDRMVMKLSFMAIRQRPFKYSLINCEGRLTSWYTVLGDLNI